jgi:protein-L-isoaspartate O-methyltransferase
MPDVERLKEIVTNEQEADWNGILANACDSFLTEQLSHLRANLLGVADLTAECRVLELHAGYGALTGAIAERAKSVLCVEADGERTEVNRIRQQGRENVRFVQSLAEAEQTAGEAGMTGGKPAAFDRILHLNEPLTENGDTVEHLEVLVAMLAEDGMLVALSDACHVQELMDWTQQNHLFYRLFYPRPDARFMVSLESEEYLNQKKHEEHAGQPTQGADRACVLQIKKRAFAAPYLLYSKYSNERARALSIVTEIYQDSQGRWYVKKSNCYKEGAGHIQQMAKLGQALSDMYAPHGLAVVGCRMEEESAVMPYIDGITMTEQLGRIREAEGSDALLEQLRSFVLLVRFMHEESEFEVTDAFEAVFGTTMRMLTGQGQQEKRYRSAKVNNIDLLFDNILIADGKKYVIDYEWTFEFPVPVDFILYRIFHYYLLENEITDAGFKERVMALLDLSDREQMVFGQMEKCFQQYILGGTVPLGAIVKAEAETGTFGQNLRMTAAEGGAGLEKRAGMIYYDFGAGYSEKDAVPYFPDQSGDVCRVTIEVPAGCRNIRLDPIEESRLFFHMVSLCDSDGNDLWEQAVPNAPRIGNDIYFLETEDPWFAFPVREGQTVCAVYFMTRLDDAAAAHLTAVMQERIAQVNAKAQQDKMHASPVWKAAAPLRKLFSHKKELGNGKNK